MNIRSLGSFRVWMRRALILLLALGSLWSLSLGLGNTWASNFEYENRSLYQSQALTFLSCALLLAVACVGFLIGGRRMVRLYCRVLRYFGFRANCE